ncbi:hypothetical protein GCM10009069_29810 [Algimonas arctica]|uniref:Terminase large subunit gp17-like C-terminal domain-containing protein n=1 Tax=Algimonas arctica TaxID=1479486 RepID=A0A8J3G3M8_9PROT|nr:phage terminase large subunit [Algimonas arctica]GHB05450.1 hypothetical protein GCM10009069_29810 [Algimonas arctica]
MKITGTGTDEGNSQSQGQIVQSWDTAIKTGGANDYSVCITARIWRKDIHIIDVWRGRVEFPALLRKTVELARIHEAKTLLIEDKASGSQLIQSIRAGSERGVPNPIARTPEADKFTRAAGVSSMVEAGQLFLPEEAHWLAGFKKELLAFPSSRHDDQVDAFSQLLEWSRTAWKRRSCLGGTPILFWIDGNGESRHSGDDKPGGLFSGL